MERAFNVFRGLNFFLGCLLLMASPAQAGSMGFHWSKPIAGPIHSINVGKTSTYQVKSLSVNGQGQSLSNQKIQAQLSTSANSAISGTLCDSNCINQLQVVGQNNSGINKNQICAQAQVLLSQASAFNTSFFTKAVNAACAADGYSADVNDLVQDALKNADFISKDNQGNLDVQSGDVDVTLAPVNNPAAEVPVSIQPQQPVVVSCSTGQYLGEDGQCHAPAAPACPVGQGISEVDGKCHDISTSNKCPAGQAILETDGQCHVIQATVPGPTEK